MSAGKLLSHVTQAKEGTKTHPFTHTITDWHLNFVLGAAGWRKTGPQSTFPSLLLCNILTLICIVDIRFIGAKTKWVEAKCWISSNLHALRLARMMNPAWFLLWCKLLKLFACFQCCIFAQILKCSKDNSEQLREFFVPKVSSLKSEQIIITWGLLQIYMYVQI